MNTENNIAIVCITDNGKNLAVKIQKKHCSNIYMQLLLCDVSHYKTKLPCLMPVKKHFSRGVFT